MRLNLPAQVFITGTDTGVGKTYISCQLLKQLNKQNLRTAALKPVSAGCEWQDGQLVNEDALLLQQAMSLDLPYSTINPIALVEACSPHIAAAHEGIELKAVDIAARCQEALTLDCDHFLVEGAGGWYAPISQKETMADLAKALNLPVLLVVDIRLGCLNHALLTVEAIEKSGLILSGWIANAVDGKMAYFDENIATLERLIRQQRVDFE